MNQIEQQTIYSPYQIKEKSKNLFLFWMIASVLALRCMGGNDAVSDLLLLAIPISVMGAIMFFSGSAEKERMLTSFFCKRESQIRESLCLEQTLLDIKARQPKPVAQSVLAKLPDKPCSSKAKKKKQGSPKPAKQSSQVTTKTKRAEQKMEEEDRFIDYEDYFKTSPPEPVKTPQYHPPVSFADDYDYEDDYDYNYQNKTSEAAWKEEQRRQQALKEQQQRELEEQLEEERLYWEEKEREEEEERRREEEEERRQAELDADYRESQILFYGDSLW